MEANVKQNEIDPEVLKSMSKEERIKLIRFGPNSEMNKPKQVAVDLLQKYKPKLNLNQYKIIAQEFEKDYCHNIKQISLDRANMAISLLSEKEQAKIAKLEKRKKIKSSMNRIKQSKMRRSEIKHTSPSDNTSN